MAMLFDLVKVNIPTAGTGDVTFGTPFSPGFFAPDEVGAIDGNTPRYVIVDGDDVEMGVGLIKSTVTQMERTVLRSRISGVAGTSKINLSGTAFLAFTAAAVDIINPADPAALDKLGFGAMGKQLAAAADEAAALADLPNAYHRGNILGTVSQSGGTPTGAIIERGSNANGEYIRWADGTQICYRVSRLPAVAVNNGTSVTCVFAAAFANTNYRIQYSAMTEIGSGGQSATGAVYDNGIYTGVYGAGQFNLNCFAYQRAVPNPVDFFVSIIGRWF